MGKQGYVILVSEIVIRRCSRCIYTSVIPTENILEYIYDQNSLSLWGSIYAIGLTN